MQYELCLRLLQLCKKAGLHTAVEISVFCKWKDLERFLPWLDMLILDIKHMDDEKRTGDPVGIGAVCRRKRVSGRKGRIG